MLIDKVRNTENDYLLKETMLLFDNELENIDIYRLNDKEREEVTIGLKDINNPNYLTDYQANKEIEEWLNE